MNNPGTSALDLAPPVLSLRVLVAEDNRLNRMMVCECLKRNGHQAIVAENGAQAVALFDTEKPDVVLLDIVMPVMDGLEAAKLIRAQPLGATIPLLFLSGVDDEKSKLASLSLADGLISKPIEPKLLAARLSAFFRQVQLQHQYQEQIKQTQQALNLLQAENELGAYVLSRMLDTALKADQCVRFINRAAVNFSGDLVLYSRCPAGKYYVLLADAVGHGIAAAFNVFPLMSIFTAMARRGVTPGEIIRQMNSSLHTLMPVDRFISAALVCIDPTTLTMEAWNGGMPPILVLDARGECKHEFNSLHMPLRLESDADIDCKPVVHELSRGDEILMFSDGLLEANRQSVEAGLSHLRAMMRAEPEETRFEKISAWLESGAVGTFHDDTSLISIRTSQMQLQQS
ncbi:MAG: fused response regulator/phosphatase [Burkholderiaceae bacterium]|nr:MAG: fused response regulator/phosphatase [Burkholderiaceae bacterium]